TSIRSNRSSHRVGYTNGLLDPSAPTSSASFNGLSLTCAVCCPYHYHGTRSGRSVWIIQPLDRYSVLGAGTVVKQRPFQHRQYTAVVGLRLCHCLITIRISSHRQQPSCDQHDSAYRSGIQCGKRLVESVSKRDSAKHLAWSN